MKTKSSIFFLFFLLPLFSFGEDNIYPTIRDIKYEDTPLYDFFVNYEKVFINTYPFLFFEFKMDELEEDSRDLFYQNFVYKQTFCKNHIDNKSSLIDEFCLFFNKVSNNDYKSLETFQFKDNILSELRYIFLSLQYGKDGFFDKFEEKIAQVKEKSLLIFYRDLFKVMENNEINDDRLRYLSCIYNYYKNGNICVMDSEEDYEGILSFFKAKNYFYEGDYIKSAQFFILSQKNPKIQSISLENAIYALFHAGEYVEALRMAKNANVSVRSKITFLVSFLEGVKLVHTDVLFNERGFDTFILKAIKDRINKGASLSYLKNFIYQSENEDVNFYLCLVSVINMKDIDKCIKKSWNKDFYNSFMSLISQWYQKNFNYDNVENKKEIEDFIEKRGLKNYYPFNFLLAEIAFENDNFDKAQKIYEYFVRYPKHITGRELAESYYKLGVIFKNKKSYYTALKLLEKNLSESFNGIRDKSRVEYVKILMLKDKCDEIIIYVPIFVKDMKNEHLKKEINEIFNFCVAEKNKVENSKEVNK